MNHHLAGIDHVLIGVRDLDRAQADYARLGFTSTPRGLHRGWGTANHCIMFERDYLELLGIVDPSGFTGGLDRFLAEREGVLGLALLTGNPEATRDGWQAAGLDSAEVKDLARVLEDEGGETLLQFRNVMLAPEDTQDLRIFACAHLTPEPMRRPEWLLHPNGARAIASVTVLAPDPDSFAPTLARLFGQSRLTTTDRMIAAHTGHGVVMVASEDDLDMLHPELEPLTPGTGPVVAVLSLVVDDPDRTAAWLTDSGVPFGRDKAGAVGVAPRDARGVMLEFLPPEAAPEVVADLELAAG